MSKSIHANGTWHHVPQEGDPGYSVTKDCSFHKGRVKYSPTNGARDDWIEVIGSVCDIPVAKEPVNYFIPGQEREGVPYVQCSGGGGYKRTTFSNGFFSIGITCGGSPGPAQGIVYMRPYVHKGSGFPEENGTVKVTLSW